MTEEELKQKVEEYVYEFKFNKDCSKCLHSNSSECANKPDEDCLLGLLNYSVPKPRQAFKDGYKQGQEDFDSKVTKLLNSYGVKFIDTNSIGGLIALHQLMLELEQENEELKKTITEKNSEVEKLLKLGQGNQGSASCKGLGI